MEEENHEVIVNEEGPLVETEEIKKEDEKPVVISERETELLDKLLRLRAEFSNFQKRTEKEKKETIINANINLISELLSVLDNFELSLKHNDDKGVLLIHNELYKILEDQGLELISTSEKFNPEFHEAIAREDGESDGEIIEEFQKGYMLNGKLIRASKVKISVKTK